MGACLLLCFFNSGMSFPGSSRHAQKNSLNVQIYCRCCSPHRQLMEEIIQCQLCTEWYHGDCAGVLVNHYKDFVCSICFA
ncbi:hypothetical protein LSH36_2322g00000 [Paralvinella palmiformis]|uniref:PHD-type domain-containing protein n=1 Tax=Paralvinella palmiformis TaxID=53620 RepID=A0AAD9MQ51_9ANNE|nr:hypothetical protein LSH36_2322g00000 [Paralvinella palmiformis]